MHKNIHILENLKKMATQFIKLYSLIYLSGLLLIYVSNNLHSLSMKYKLAKYL